MKECRKDATEVCSHCVPPVKDGTEGCRYCMYSSYSQSVRKNYHTPCVHAYICIYRCVYIIYIYIHTYIHIHIVHSIFFNALARTTHMHAHTLSFLVVIESPYFWIHRYSYPLIGTWFPPDKTYENKSVFHFPKVSRLVLSFVLENKNQVCATRDRTCSTWDGGL